jgi:hypothetical protein
MTCTLPPAPITERARRYIATMPPSISGSGGSTALLKVAIALVRGFDLSPDEAFHLLDEWNGANSQPPWSERDLRHKLEDALKSKADAGYLIKGDDKNRPQTAPRPPARFTPAKPTRSELEAFRKRRGLSSDAITCAVTLGALRVGNHSQFGRVLAMAEGEWWQCRPLNAETFRNGQKTMSRPGPAPKFFGSSWLGDYPELLLVEGVVGWLEGVDAILTYGDATWGVLAAYHEGSSFSNDLATAGKLHGRRITIVPDAGAVGAQAALRWRAELIALGVEVRIFPLPDGCKDLGDLLKHDAAAETFSDLFQQPKPNNEAQ